MLFAALVHCLIALTAIHPNVRFRLSNGGAGGRTITGGLGRGAGGNTRAATQSPKLTANDLFNLSES
jgi:hypothetical protein